MSGHSHSHSEGGGHSHAISAEADTRMFDGAVGYTAGTARGLLHQVSPRFLLW